MFYANGALTLLAPRGWPCSGTVGADGNAQMTISASNDSGEGVTAQADSACVGCSAAIACPLFHAASDALPGIPCTPNSPPEEEKTRINATTVAFEDPPYVKGTGTPSGGADPANGVMSYSDGTAIAETCTLPQSGHSFCTFILNDFLSRDIPG